MKLTRHFDTDEFQSPDGVPMGKWHRDQLRKLCQEYLEPLRDCFGPVTINSGFRSKNYNAHVGGARSSFHMREDGRVGAAADVTCARGRPADWYRFLDQMNPGGLGLYPTHVHVDDRVIRARW